MQPQEASLMHKDMRPSARQSKRKCGASGGLLATKPRDLERFIDDYSYSYRQVKKSPSDTKAQLLRPCVLDLKFESRALLLFYVAVLVGAALLAGQMQLLYMFVCPFSAQI